MSKFSRFWRRVKAFMLDYLLIAAYLILLTGAGVVANRLNPALLPTLFANPILGQISGFFMVTLPVSLYFALSESSSWQATWGKRKLGLKVVRTDGSRLSRGRALARTALKFIPWELSHTCVWQASFAQGQPSPLITVGFIVVWGLIGLYIASLLTSETGQTLYDRLVGVTVVQG